MVVICDKWEYLLHRYVLPSFITSFFYHQSFQTVFNVDSFLLLKPKRTEIGSCDFALDCVDPKILHEIKISLWAKSGRKGWV